MQIRRVKAVLAVIALATTLNVAGCATGKAHHATSVVDYLYPEEGSRNESTGTPVLKLPLQVGIAFVPGDGQYTSSTAGLALRPGSSLGLTERQKMDLMREVARHFQEYPFVKNIELIPTAYLTPRGGFTNLDQVRRMYNVDVIALLSYDQAQFTDESSLSLTYLTLVGAYVIPGEKNDTHTMLDAVVYDIPSRKMLFRAPGTSHIKGRSTYANLSEQRRIDSEAGFKDAAKEMIENLDQQLALFREKAKERPQEIKVIPDPNAQ